MNPERVGTKAAAHYLLTVPADGAVTVCLRLFSEDEVPEELFGRTFDRVFDRRLREADEFYASRIPRALPDSQKQIARQAYAGLLWSKQFYNYIVEAWLKGDPSQPPPPKTREQGRNHDWMHLFNRDVLSMPDKWEYPWYAAWDLAFHMIPFVALDPGFAKEQLVLMLREWYMHPNGQIPAYEWNFADVNPPVHAWACWRIYKMTGPRGKRDRLFLSRVFQKLLVNFTWWVNRKDVEGKHLFAGGFLGLDNIGVFDRSRPLPEGEHLSQADGTAWMAFYCATMMSMALELSKANPAYEDIASKFFEHFVAIADAMNRLGGTGLWNDEDGFYYDHLQVDGASSPLRARSLVGLIPLIAVEVLEEDELAHLPGFRKRMQWFLDNRQDLARQISYMQVRSVDGHGHRLLAIPSLERLVRVLRYVLDESEFLSPYGVRSLSRYHKFHHYTCPVGGAEQQVAYVPGDSNWRGPIWFPINYLLIEALERYHHYYGDELKVECPTGSGRKVTLGKVACEIGRRLLSIFLPDEKAWRPWQGEQRHYRDDPHWRDLSLFHEYFHGDTGQGLGASHQTGWTALVTRLLQEPGVESIRKHE